MWITTFYHSGCICPRTTLCIIHVNIILSQIISILISTMIAAGNEDVSIFVCDQTSFSKIFNFRRSYYSRIKAHLILINWYLFNYCLYFSIFGLFFLRKPIHLSYVTFLTRWCSLENRIGKFIMTWVIDVDFFCGSDYIIMRMTQPSWYFLVYSIIQEIAAFIRKD